MAVPAHPSPLGPPPGPLPGPPATAAPGRTRLRRRQDVVAAIREGQRVSHRLLTLAHRPNGLPHNRYAYATPRRIGGAVVRNRVRRRLRAILHTLPLRPGYDIVIMARPDTATASFRELTGVVESCARRGKLLMAAPNHTPAHTT